MDGFGRSKSRSRSNSPDRNRHLKGQRGRGFGGRGRQEAKGGRRPRRRDGSSSSSSSSDRSTEPIRLVAREEPKYLNARVFVANIISKEVTKEDLTKHFEKYGNVVDILIHPKNYAFIQYLKEDHAKLAVEGEHGATYNSLRLDVKMANAGRRGPPVTPRGGGRGRGRGRGDPYMDRGPDRDFSPSRGDPFGDPYGPRGPRRPMPPYPGEFGMRDPFYPPPDPYRRGFADPWLPPPDDPFRRDPYADPYRDPYGPPVRAPPPPPTECEIFLVNAQLRGYGEAISDKVKGLSIISAVTVMPEGRTASQMLEELSQRNGLFAIFVNAQNETHRSLTLNILHGTPQEHRNMPLNDAVGLIERSFEQYVETLRAKANKPDKPGFPEGSAGGSTNTSRLFLAPTQEVTYLLNLLADNRALTVVELDQVITYLEERRDKLSVAEGRPPAQEDQAAKERQQQVINSEEITNKILSIFTSAGGTVQGVPPANGTGPGQPSSQTHRRQHDTNNSSGGAGPGAPAPPPPPASSSSNLINFDNPNVQKALDSLMQSASGSGLLRNLNSPPGSTAGHMDAQASGGVTSGSVPRGGSGGHVNHPSFYADRGQEPGYHRGPAPPPRNTAGPPHPPHPQGY